jgi:hypothetical protein
VNRFLSRIVTREIESERCIVPVGAVFAREDVLN